jgi:DNA repair exonuclease SbcCD ATPase subunit
MNKDYEKKEQEIEKAYRDGNADVARAEKALQDAVTKRDSTIAKLQQERDAIALKSKLAEFPAKLVKSHKTCSVCGADMRPFTIAQGETVKKIWACAAGSLSELHDLVAVE